jgi:RNA polymerase sigma-70 factor (ECF subfamily)
MTAFAIRLPSGARRREDGDSMMAWLRDRLKGTPASEQGPEADEAALVEALRDGDEAAYTELIDRYGPSMLRVAQLHVRDRQVAEEVVQETWLGVLRGIDRFEGRSSFKTWLFRILTNRAKTRGEREGRVIPFSAVLAADAAAGDGPAVDADRFFDIDDPSTPCGWSAPPRAWTQDRVIERETLGVVKEAIEALPTTQREVIRLRDVEGWSAEEVAAALELSDVNQRVLLHRARSRVRAALEAYLNPEVGVA